MCLMLAGRVSAVVAAEAIVGIVDVIEIRWNPRDGRVTVIAIIAACDMRRVLACCYRAIVTGAASANNLRMVHPIGGGERHVVVTVLANIGGLDMCRVLAGGIGAVVAAEAVVDYICVVKIGWYPCCGRVAIIAVVTAADVRRVLAFCNRAIVTGVAGANNPHVIDPVCRCKEHVVMAVLTHIRRLNVHQALTDRVRAVVATEAVRGDIDVIEIRRNPTRGRMTIIAVVTAADVIQVFAGCGLPIMAGHARAQDLRMVDEVGRCENNVVMAVLADIRCLDMRRILAGCLCAVMATETVAGNCIVVKIRRHPGTGRVAIVAVIAAGNMRRVLAGCGNTVVTGIAGANDLHVINQVGRRENDIVVTVFANIARLYMCRVLAERVGAVMTAEAIIGDVDVIEIRRHPANRRVAIITVIAAGDMRRVFPGRDRTVVAGITGADDLGVIEGVRRYKLRRVVAVFAGVRRLNVSDWFSRGIHTVVAANAVTGNASVIKNRRYPAIGLMAILALI